MNLYASWLVELMVFMPNTPLGVEEDVPNPEQSVVLCEGPLCVDSAAVLKIEPVVLEDEGCNSAVEVVSGVRVSSGERFVQNSTSVAAEGALKLLLLGLRSVVLKRPCADGASDVVLVEEPSPEKVALGKLMTVELAFEAGSLADMALEPNKPPFGVSFETPLLEGLAFKLNGLRDGNLDISLLRDTLLKAATVDEGLVCPNELLPKGVWVTALLIAGAEFEPNRLPPGDCVLF